MESQNKSSIGSIIGTIIIIAIIILGGLYFWGKRVEESKLKQDLVSQNSEQPTQMQNNTGNINKTSDVDDLNSINADLKASNFNNLDAELNGQTQ